MSRGNVHQGRHVSKVQKALARHFEIEALDSDLFDSSDDDSDTFYEMLPERTLAHLDV